MRIGGVLTCGLVMTLSTVRGTEPATAVSREIRLPVEVEYEGGSARGGLIASGRFPKRFRVRDLSGTEKVAEDVLQQLGFAINPPKPKVATRPVFGDLDTSWKVVWTDMQDLDADLPLFGRTREQLRLSADSRVVYGYQIVVALKVQSAIRQAMSARATMGPVEEGVDLRVAILLSKRGTRSSFVPETGSYDNGPIVDWIVGQMAERLKKIQPFWLDLSGKAVV